MLAVLSVAFAIVSYTTRWDWLLHDDMVEKVASRFDLSYSNDAALPVQRGDPEWAPLLRLIEKYSPGNGGLPKDRPPMTFARAPAITSAQTPFGEWTGSRALQYCGSIESGRTRAAANSNGDRMNSSSAR